MGWWSDVLADAIQRSGKLHDRRLLFAARRTSARRSRPSTAASAAPSPTKHILDDRSIEAIINTTPNAVHLETTTRRGRRPASTCSSTSRSPTPSPTRAPSPRRAARPRWCSRSGYQRRRESHFRWVKQTHRRTSASSSTPRPTSAATGSARSTSPRGATPPRACPAASCCRSASTTPTCSST